MKHINNIIEIKQQNPDISMFDIIMEYCGEHEEEFDVDDFIHELRSHKGFREFIRRDLVEFNFGKDVEFIDTFADLF
jgi:hypothetical protein